MIAGPDTFTATPLNNATLAAPDKRALIAFQKQVADLQRAALGAVRVVDDVKERIGLIKKALHDAPAAPEHLRTVVLTLEDKIKNIERAFRGDRTLQSRFEATPPTILDRVNDVVGDLWTTTSAPTKTHIKNYEIAGDEFAPVLAELKTLVTYDLKAIEDSLDVVGAPWTPGRIPEWKR